MSTTNFETKKCSLCKVVKNFDDFKRFKMTQSRKCSKICLNCLNVLKHNRMPVRLRTDLDPDNPTRDFIKKRIEKKDIDQIRVRIEFSCDVKYMERTLSFLLDCEEKEEKGDEASEV